jgi:hypothetical protein
MIPTTVCRRPCEAGWSTRNVVRQVGPGNINTDLALFKDFPIAKSVSLRFRAEAFNAFGNVNLNNPKTGLTALNANAALPPAQQSQITGAAAPRIWQFAAKLRF